MASSDRSQRLNGLQNGVIGSLAGMIEVMIQQPTIAIKNAVQQSRPIPWSVPTLYRGIGVTLSSIAPISAIQFAANGKLLALASSGSIAAIPPPQDSDTKQVAATSNSVKIACGAMAGSVSALVGCPAELVMTLQQNHGQSFIQTIRSVASQHGASRLYRGLVATTMREAVWCSCYLALAPVASDTLHELVPSTFGTREEATLSQRTSAAVSGSILAGLFTIYVTQPIDTIKTVMQGEALHNKKVDGFVKTSTRVWKEGGLSRVYRGTVARGGRLIGAVFILGQARNFLEKQFDEHKLLA